MSHRPHLAEEVLDGFKRTTSNGLNNGGAQKARIGAAKVTSLSKRMLWLRFRCERKRPTSSMSGTKVCALAMSTVVELSGRSEGDGEEKPVQKRMEEELWSMTVFAFMHAPNHIPLRNILIRIS